MSGLEARLEHGPCVLLDGGMGTALLARGLAAGAAPERLNFDQPELVTVVHAEFVAAGSEAIQTNSFGGHPLRLARFGLAARCEAIQQRAVQRARAAEPRWVLGNIGPTGELLPAAGTGEAGAWREGFRLQAGALLEAGVDGIHIETMGDLREATLALEAVRGLDVRIPCLVSLSFVESEGAFFTLRGDPLEASLQRLTEAGATVVGANCSLGSEAMGRLALEALAQLDGRLVFQANAGQPRIDGGGPHYEQSPEEFALHMVPVIEAGAAAIGGCCGCGPAFVAALAARLDRAPHA